MTRYRTNLPFVAIFFYFLFAIWVLPDWYFKGELDIFLYFFPFIIFTTLIIVFGILTYVTIEKSDLYYRKFLSNVKVDIHSIKEIKRGPSFFLFKELISSIYVVYVEGMTEKKIELSPSLFSDKTLHRLYADLTKINSNIVVDRNL